MRRRRLLDSCILATTLRSGPVKAKVDVIDPKWVEPSSPEKIARYAGADVRMMFTDADGNRRVIEGVTEITYAHR